MDVVRPWIPKVVVAFLFPVMLQESKRAPWWWMRGARCGGWRGARGTWGRTRKLQDGRRVEKRSCGARFIRQGPLDIVPKKRRNLELEQQTDRVFALVRAPRVSWLLLDVAVWEKRHCSVLFPATRAHLPGSRTALGAIPAVGLACRLAVGRGAAGET